MYLIKSRITNEIFNIRLHNCVDESAVFYRLSDLKNQFHVLFHNLIESKLNPFEKNVIETCDLLHIDILNETITKTKLTSFLIDSMIFYWAQHIGYEFQEAISRTDIDFNKYKYVLVYKPKNLPRGLSFKTHRELQYILKNIENIDYIKHNSVAFIPDEETATLITLSADSECKTYEIAKFESYAREYLRLNKKHFPF